MARTAKREDCIVFDSAIARNWNTLVRAVTNNLSLELMDTVVAQVRRVSARGNPTGPLTLSSL